MTPHKKNPLEWFNGCTCACQSPQLCVPLVKRFAALEHPQGGFWTFPAKLKPLEERGPKQRTPQVREKIAQNAALRAAWSNHIRPHERTEYISRVHFHPSVVALSRYTTTKNGNRRYLLPSAVPREMAELIGKYTNADQIPGCPNGDYFPVPNCPLDIAKARLDEMEAVASNPHSPPPMSANSIAMAELSPVIVPPLSSAFAFVLFFWIHPSLS